MKLKCKIFGCKHKKHPTNIARTEGHFLLSYHCKRCGKESRSWYDYSETEKFVKDVSINQITFLTASEFDVISKKSEEGKTVSEVTFPSFADFEKYCGSVGALKQARHLYNYFVSRIIVL